MTAKLTIGLIGLMTVVLIFTGGVSAERMESSAVDEQMVQVKETVKIACDPCDYNIDYGTEYLTDDIGSTEIGFVEFECDPCDYNIDYGTEYHHTEE